ncbi:stage II sporulation protein D [Mobilisporobacter senegalensis]|uniref:Stage II sporulation protein D n=1 Tax=Mobilisporobacter senegalensis TaxID=1329262 RepID=A0A3N1XY43_9FIRM|nr:SpoIID/LytB domain-containing protein [Mobilisporobacter senegalensis]ROR31500.1 stage II sporulation protein D [Mobilisporobacter senegalensis]
MKKKLMLILIGIIIIIIILAIDLMNDHELLDNIIDREPAEVHEEVTYSNVWIIGNDGNIIEAFVEGKKQKYTSQYPLSEDIGNVIGDIVVKDKEVIKITIKPDKMNGKVLAYTDEYIEIEDLGKIDTDKDFKIYKIYDDIMMEMSSGILIGYSSTDFIFSDGTICAAIIKEEAKPKNIRVVLKNNDTGDIFHNSVRLTSDSDYVLYYGDKKKEYKAGHKINVKPNNKLLSEGRIRIEPKSKDAKIEVLSLTRSSGIPKYRGKIEIGKNKEGLTIINELTIEEYLYSVVPSEMPSSYGLEALEVQAICARSYAYTQLSNNAYHTYGAHVDDSVSYQVYNNIGENEVTVKAVDETRGLIMEYKGNIISAYYFSTSSGHTSSAKDVWMSENTIPYLVGSLQAVEDKKAVEAVNNEAIEVDEELDLTKESNFRNFIKKSDIKTYDSDFAWYRWKVTIDAGDLKKVIDKNLAGRYNANPALIKTLQKDNTYSSVPIDTVGNVENITISKRATGGIATEMTIKGSKNTIKVMTEYNIRTILAPLYSKVIRQDKSVVDNLSMLPSAFVVVDHNKEGGKLKSITFTGGGYGHGVGMSQNGVKAMAELGKSYEEILKHYYPGIDIVMNGEVK